MKQNDNNADNSRQHERWKTTTNYPISNDINPQMIRTVGRNKAIFSSSDYDHICNDRILTIKSEFALRPYSNSLSLDYDHIFKYIIVF